MRGSRPISIATRSVSRSSPTPGLETGVRHEACYVLRQGDITFVLASPLRADHPDAMRLVRHGDGVQSIALEVDDVYAAFELALARGAQAAAPPRTIEDEFGSYDVAEIHAYGDTTHTFVNRSKYRGVFAPGFQPLDADRYSPRTFHPVGLKVIDHIVANVEEGKMGDWVDYYNKVMGFSLLVSFDDKDISTDYSALMSKVVADGRGRIKFPINEPAKSRRRSQIEEFLDYYGGPGVQHIALATGDIIASVKAMAANDVSFLKVPPAYYELLPDRVGTDQRRHPGAGRAGHPGRSRRRRLFAPDLYQAGRGSADPVLRDHPAPGARSFGKGNFKALFEAIEREQARRGTL